MEERVFPLKFSANGYEKSILGIFPLFSRRVYRWDIVRNYIGAILPFLFQKRGKVGKNKCGRNILAVVFAMFIMDGVRVWLSVLSYLYVDRILPWWNNIYKNFAKNTCLSKKNML